MKNSIQGIVLIVALFIVALIAVMAIAMMGRLTRDTYRTGFLLHNMQAYLYAEASVLWAENQLLQDWIKKQPDRLIDTLPLTLPAQTLNGYRIVATIEDAQSKFNVNNLVNTSAQANFIRLLKITVPKLEDQAAVAIAAALTNWVTTGIHDSTFDKYYLGLHPPYRAAHRAMVNVSELRMIKGITAPLYQALLPFVIALPEQTQVNVQTAFWPVLASLSTNMDLASAEAVERARQASPFVSVEKFLNLDVIKNHPVSRDKVTVTSSYFLVTTQVSIGMENYLFYTLLFRSVKENKPEIQKVWQSRI